MSEFPEVNKDDKIKETIITLNTISYQVAELLRIKEELEKRLCNYLEHGDDGSKTYTCDKWKATVTTGWNYTLDKEEYEILKDSLPACFNPVVERVAYDLDKKIIKDCEKYGSSTELELLSKIVSKKPKKLHIKITAGV